MPWSASTGAAACCQPDLAGNLPGLVRGPGLLLVIAPPGDGKDRDRGGERVPQGLPGDDRGRADEELRRGGGCGAAADLMRCGPHCGWARTGRVSE
ncbi:hypothetical protein GCM10023205_77180 [Yinghuangia aomiensis]|uniref:Uncharacterized protein n=1 Tax=Yinghuangia aomiensis TaxID=676205 RepID=A0ABP9ICH1_9ACTN